MADETNGDNEELSVFGVDADTGKLLKLKPEEAIAMARSVLNEPLVNELQSIHKTQFHYAPNADVNAWAMEEVGWGLVFPVAVDAEAKKRRAEIEEALKPLIDLRKEEVGDRYHVLEWAKNETREDFLGRYNQPTGPIDPDLVPYHQLILSGPDVLTFDHQYSLDVPASVGRLWFDELDSDDAKVRQKGLDALQRYATMLRDLEKGKQYPRSRTMRFVGTANGDPATAQSSTRLVPPLATGIKAKNWTLNPALVGDGATRAAFAARLGGAETPAILFTATHGMEYRADDARQRALQGALVCQEWSGDSTPLRGELFAAEDIPDDADVAGMIAFLFACHGAGTPVDNQFTKLRGPHASKLTSKPFIAALPNRLLSHEKGPALAVVGHVERAFPSSFVFEGVDQLTHYKSMLRGLAKGQRVGHAMENFGQRFSDLATILLRDINRIDNGLNSNAIIRRVIDLWTVAHDARNYILLGDPAARIPPVA